MKYQSIIEARSEVKFPEFLGERVYMREFYKGKLPEALKRWTPTVDAMLDGVDTDGPIYIMIDEKHVKAGEAQRRRGIHIDGYWNPGISAHGNGHLPSPGRHGGGHGIRMHEGGTHSDRQHHSSMPFGHRPLTSEDLMRRHQGLPVVWTPPKAGGKKKRTTGWEHATFEQPEAIILASSVSAAMGYTGEFEGPIGEGGDCSHVDLTTLNQFRMKNNLVYAGNVCCLHESIPVEEDCYRSLVRLNVPGWSVH